MKDVEWINRLEALYGPSLYTRPWRTTSASMTPFRTGRLVLKKIVVVIRPTRTLSKPDGICSSGVGQHLVKARHANLPYNAQTADLPRECGPAVPVEEVDQPVSSQTTAYPAVLSPVPEALDATRQGYSICGDLAHRARHPRRHL